MSKKGSKTLASILLDAIRRQMLDLRVCMPARVETYDHEKQRANVKPLLKKQYARSASTADTGPTELPVITDVPLQWPSAAGGDAYLHLPVVAGDLGVLLFADRSLDNWLSGSGQIVAPEDARMHHLKDAIFVPGLRPFGAPLSDASATNAVLQNNRMRIEMDPSGKISISGADEEFLSIVDSMLDHLINARVATAMGAMPFYHTTLSDLASDRARLATIKRV